jgi:hypothetical protein
MTRVPAGHCALAVLVTGFESNFVSALVITGRGTVDAEALLAPTNCAVIATPTTKAIIKAVRTRPCPSDAPRHPLIIDSCCTMSPCRWWPAQNAPA